MSRNASARRTSVRAREKLTEKSGHGAFGRSDSRNASALAPPISGRPNRRAH